MRKFIVFALFAMLFTSCYTTEDQKRLNQECKELQIQKTQLQQSIKSLNDRKDALDIKVHDLYVQKNSLQTGKEIKYIVKFKIKQGTFTIDLFEHAKNEMNSIEIEIPVY